MAHILIIDDEDSVLAIFKQVLEKAGHTVSSASGGREGLRLLERKKPDLVITDIFMPEMDGLEVILEIRKKTHQSAMNIPVIAISGGLSTSKAQPMHFLHQAETFGAARSFKKPFDFAGIHAAIRELLPAEAEPA